MINNRTTLATERPAVPINAPPGDEAVAVLKRAGDARYAASGRAAAADEPAAQ